MSIGQLLPSSTWQHVYLRLRHQEKGLISPAELPSKIVELISRIVRSHLVSLRFFCFSILDLHCCLSDDQFVTLSDLLITENSSDTVISYFIAIVLLAKFRSLNGICSRSLFRVADIVCKRKPEMVTQHLLVPLLLTFTADSTSLPQDNKLYFGEFAYVMRCLIKLIFFL